MLVDDTPEGVTDTVVPAPDHTANEIDHAPAPRACGRPARDTLDDVTVHMPPTIKGVTAFWLTLTFAHGVGLFHALSPRSHNPLLP